MRNFKQINFHELTADPDAMPLNLRLLYRAMYLYSNQQSPEILYLKRAIYHRFYVQANYRFSPMQSVQIDGYVEFHLDLAVSIY